MANNQPTYSQAIARLEEIVQAIDNGEMEIDQLADKIKEANKLIAYCSEKLTKADAELEKLLAEKQETDK
ncbi:MAG: exodeoxyribonuclease VII small subunit [Mediterranea massiliensis]|nr:exodeoxyribonuclease VII small subunit [Mediterranea massiliensis]MBO5381217.1 exodeoxyribonuclease VII small subunit [Bacteroides sp.]MBR4047385.1 exodeoxyribonuclease VII small subunit [Bacteroides sp.]